MVGLFNTTRLVEKLSPTFDHRDNIYTSLLIYGFISYCYIKIFLEIFLQQCSVLKLFLTVITVDIYFTTSIFDKIYLLL